MVLGAAETLRALPRGGGARVNIFSDRRGADEAYGLDFGIVEQRVHGFLVAIDDIENTRWEPGLNHEFGQPQRHARVALRGLQHERVAAGDGRTELPHRDHGWKVERRDASDDAERLAHRINVDSRPRRVGELAFDQMRNADREFDCLDAALDVALGVGDRLAVLSRQRFLPGGERHARDRLPGHRFEALDKAPRRAFDALAADEMGEFDHMRFPIGRRLDATDAPRGRRADPRRPPRPREYVEDDRAESRNAWRYRVGG